MLKHLAILAVFAVFILLLAGCGILSGEAPARSEPFISSQSEPVPPTPEPAGEEVPFSEPHSGPSYIEQVAREVADRLLQPDMSEYDKAKAAFDYMIETTYLVDPVGLDLWRIRGKGDAQPSFVENRSLSVLLYGIGMCEDYAAAFTMLLRAMGLEAEYVPGLTYSVEGPLVDHSWTMAKIDGIWYHLDTQLEDNVSRHGSIRYRYFMKSDQTLAASHRWGQNLIDSKLLTAEQNEEIRERFLFAECPQDYTTPAPYQLNPPPQPDANALQAEIDEEFRAYEETYGPLEPLELDIIPPVFGLEGYGPPD